MRAYGSFSARQTRVTPNVEETDKMYVDKFAEPTGEQSTFDAEVMRRAMKRCALSCASYECVQQHHCVALWPGSVNPEFTRLLTEEADKLYVEQLNRLVGVHSLHRNCGEEGCIVCEGGLGLCETCGGAESSLPTDCPGVKMTSEQMDAVSAGTLDYRSGAWRTLRYRADYNDIPAIYESRWLRGWQVLDQQRGEKSIALCVDVSTARAIQDALNKS